MKTIPFIIALFLLSVICSCEEVDCCTNFQASLEMKVMDEKGNNLLNPESPAAYSENEIQLFYLKNGEKERVFDPDLDEPKNFKIYKNELIYEYLMDITLNHYIEETTKENPVTYIQWNEQDTDTLESEFSKGDGFINLRKVWFNGKLIWNIDNVEDNDSIENYAEITKNKTG